MKRPFFYVIAWQPQAENGADRALIFRSRLVMALTEEIAYAVGQDWAEREKILPLPGPGNDYVISATAHGLYLKAGDQA